ncbi:uncharacterized protein [Dysidea avara]
MQTVIEFSHNKMSCDSLNEESLCSQFYNYSSLVYVTETTDYDNINIALSEWADGLSYEDVNSTCYLQLLFSVCVFLYPPCDGGEQHITLCHDTQCLNYITDNCDEAVKIVNMHSADEINTNYHSSLQSLCDTRKHLLEMTAKHDNDNKITIVITTAAILATFVLIVMLVFLLFKQTQGRTPLFHNCKQCKLRITDEMQLNASMQFSSSQMKSNFV